MFPFSSRPPLDPEKNGPPDSKSSIFMRAISWLHSMKRHVERTEEIEKIRWADEQPPYSEAESREASARLWSIYVGEAERYDKALVESWKADMEGMLIFSGLFSASLTAFLIESYRSLQPDSGDSTVRLLTQISEQLAALSGNTSFVSPAPPVFNASPSSLVCNVLWFLSLTLSLTCALLATLVEQWAREFLHKTEKRPSPVRRARVFAFLYFGVRRFGLHFVVDFIPLLLHIALVLFLAGLIAFLAPINQIMMGVIGGSLAIFIILYAIMTILPLVRLDCPYRTPFSAVAWNFLQNVRRWFPPSPNSPSTITDAVVDTALADSANRDRLALQWTMNSLTDDAELLPFLEAIPETIHGVRGFHLVNDYLFIPLLNGSPTQRSLGARIADFILSCRNLDSDDPRRERGLIAGMKAIWALSMISGREGELFKHGPNLWFPPSYTDLVLADITMDATDRKRWPVTVGDAASTAMVYSSIRNIENRLAFVLAMAQETVDPASMVVPLRGLLRSMDSIALLGIATDLDSTRHALKAWCDTGAPRQMVEVETLLTSLVEETIWIDIHVVNLVLFIMGAARVNFLGGDLPHEYERTCFKILPRIPLPASPSRMPAAAMFTSSVEYLDPSRYLNSDKQMANLDSIMAGLLRLLPCLVPAHAMPIFTRYLANRKDDEGLDLALKHCNLRYLMDCLVAMLGSTNDNTIILHSFHAVLVRGWNRLSVLKWEPRDDILYDFMSSQGIFDNPGFRAVSAVMRMRKLRALSKSTIPTLSSLGARAQTRQAIDRALAAWRILIAHPLVSSPVDTPPPQDATAEEILVDMQTRTTESMIVCMTDFILGSVEAPDDVASGHTMYILFICFARVSERVEPGVMVNFAAAWLALVERLIQHPNSSRLRAMLKHWTNQITASPSFYYNAAAAPLYEQALRLYLEFLQGNGTHPSDLQIPTEALAVVQAPTVT
ncbi:hypothetical protein C8R46DRAFT_474636 [Mycena filopes]|nr:hypothetical protein C8R46DRAFT_474636 [Mycena filopes]